MDNPRAATRKPHSVTWFGPRNCFKKRIARRTFYFGADRAVAEAEAAAITARWRRLRAEGHDSWPAGEPNRFAIQEALRLGGAYAGLASPTGAAPATAPNVRLAEPLTLTVGDAARLYMSERSQDGKASVETVKMLKIRLGKALDHVRRETPIADIDRTALVRFLGHWVAQVNGGSMSRIYARNICAAFKALLAWAADHDDIAWEKPRSFERMLILPVQRPRTEAEIERAKAEAWQEETRFFTIEELKKLFAKANPRMRAVILLGLNTAYSPIQMERLKASDLRTNGETWIQTIRHKTGVPSKHILWPETLKALQEADFLNKARNRRTLSLEFKELRKAAGLPDAPPLWNLKHTSANAIKGIAGGEISEVHMSHAEGLKMQGPYTDRLWEKHADAVRQLRDVFALVFTAKAGSMAK
jgi:hypothetical protein